MFFSTVKHKEIRSELIANTKEEGQKVSCVVEEARNEVLYIYYIFSVSNLVFGFVTFSTYTHLHLSLDVLAIPIPSSSSVVVFIAIILCLRRYLVVVVLTFLLLLL